MTLLEKSLGGEDFENLKLCIAYSLLCILTMKLVVKDVRSQSPASAARPPCHDEFLLLWY